MKRYICAVCLVVLGATSSATVLVAFDSLYTDDSATTAMPSDGPFLVGGAERIGTSILSKHLADDIAISPEFTGKRVSRVRFAAYNSGSSSFTWRAIFVLNKLGTDSKHLGEPFFTTFVTGSVQPGYHIYSIAVTQDFALPSHFYAGVVFTATSLANVNLLGVPIHDTVRVGTSLDGAFLSDRAVSPSEPNTVGSTVFVEPPHHTTFGWRFEVVTPEPTTIFGILAPIGVLAARRHCSLRNRDSARVHPTVADAEPK